HSLQVRGLATGGVDEAALGEPAPSRPLVPPLDEPAHAARATQASMADVTTTAWIHHGLDQVRVGDARSPAARKAVVPTIPSARGPAHPPPGAGAGAWGSPGHPP